MVSAPALARRWWAASGKGAFTRDIDGTVRKLAASGISELADATLSFNSLEQWRDAGYLDQLMELSTKVLRTRAYGDFLSYMFVAEGAIEIASEHDLKIYDIAALVPILLEAGGTITSFSGPLENDTSTVLATNGKLHEKALQILQTDA